MLVSVPRQARKSFMGAHPPGHSTGIDAPRHDLPLSGIISQSGPGTEAISVEPAPIRGPEEDGRRSARDGMIFPDCAKTGPVFRWLFPKRYRVAVTSPKGRIVNPKTLALSIAVLIAAAAGCTRNADSGNAAALEEHFRQSLSGATLVGQFTVGDRKDLREEKYTIAKVSKIPGGLWLFQVRIQYGKRDVTLPLAAQGPVGGGHPRHHSDRPEHPQPWNLHGQSADLSRSVRRNLERRRGGRADVRASGSGRESLSVRPAGRLARISHQVAGGGTKAVYLQHLDWLHVKGLRITDGAGHALACPFPLSAHMLARP